MPNEAMMIATGTSFSIGATVPWLVINSLEKKGKCCVHPQVKLHYSGILGVLLCLPVGIILWSIGLLVVMRKVIDPKQWKTPILISLSGAVFIVTCMVILLQISNR